MLDYPLTKANRLRLARAFRNVERVDLSLDCVIEGQMGRAYVDDPAQPTVFKIQTGPFAYLAGDATGPAAEPFLRSLAHDLFMPSAPGWVEAAQKLYGDRLRPFDRYRCSAEALSLEHLSRLRAASRYGERVRAIDGAVAESVWGKDHFIDLSAYDSVADFLERGVGVYVAVGEQLAGAALASLACSRGIEVSLYVEEEFRRQGLATALCVHLLSWCLERGLEPHWDAANPESAQLALKLGYRMKGGYCAYYVAR
jgi:GNAT superfamily N-acetyltransferase